jgi:2-iminobutanoate/2-iminopropanoate deaminase
MGGEAIQPDAVAVPAAPYSPVVVSGDLVVTAGQVAFDKGGRITSDEIEGQTRQVLDNLRRCLEAAGCGLEDVIKVNAWLTDMGSFAAFNDVYRDYFHEPFPVRTTVQAGLAPNILVEIDAMARRPGSR